LPLAPLALLGLYLIGMMLALYPVFLSGFGRVPGDFGDARLVNYLLEHSWHWLLRQPPHEDLWSPPFFYPTSNVAAYSDILLSVGPLYWPWRALGVAPEVSFSLCFVTLASLNYLTMYLFAVRCVRLTRPAATFAAFLFAFASPRLVHISHMQLYAHFYTLLALYGLLRLLQEPAGRWAALFFAGLVGQFYASFYLGWFLGLALLVCLAWALTVPDYRARLGSVVRARPWVFGFWGLLAALALGDLAQHYLLAARTAGYQDDELIRWGIPFVTSWWSRGEESWFNLTNALVALGLIDRNPWPRGEHALGLGPITYAVVFLGVWRLPRRRLVAILLGAALTLLVGTTAVAPDVSLWQYLYPFIPAAPAVRALCRLALLMLIPMSLCAAWAFQELATRRPRLALVLALLCVLEQGRSLGAYDRAAHRRDVQELAAAIPSPCRAFLVVAVGKLPGEKDDTDLQLDAMWASLETGVPTVNGYSGRVPPGWKFDLPRESEIEDLLKRWLNPHRLTSYPAYRGARVYVVDEPGPSAPEVSWRLRPGPPGAGVGQSSPYISREDDGVFGKLYLKPLKD
jgi:hypothetical protein